MSKSAWITIVVTALVLIVGGWWLLTKNNQPTQAPAISQVSTPVPTVSPTMEASSSAGPVASSSAIMVAGSEFSFTPNTLTAKVGEPTTITFKNEGKYPHNFTITELNVKGKTIQPGQEDTITFTPTKAGTFTYFCSVDSHEEKGMKGTLTVQ